MIKSKNFNSNRSSLESLKNVQNANQQRYIKIKRQPKQHRPQTTEKRVHKFSTQPSVSRRNQEIAGNFYNSTISDYKIIQNLKKMVSQSQNKNKLVQINSISSQLETPPLGFAQKQQKMAHSHKISYRRNLTPDRIVYKSLTDELSRTINKLRSVVSKIGSLSSKDIFQLKNQHIYAYLEAFFTLISRECYQKSMFISELWKVIFEIFQQLIEKMMKQSQKTEIQLLNQSKQTHCLYQQKFQEMAKQIAERQMDILKYKQIISKISLKNRKKCRKNRQITHGIVRIVDRMSVIQKQRNQLQSEYINMLTLGYEGGMGYEQAKKFINSKFRTDKGSSDSQIDSSNSQEKQNDITQKDSCLQNFTQVGQNSLQNKQRQESKYDNKLIQRKIRKSKKQKSAVVFPTAFQYSNDNPNLAQKVRKSSKMTQQQKMAKKIYKIKQKYIYGSNRLVIPDEQDDSNDEDMKMSIFNAKNSVSFSNKNKLIRFCSQNQEELNNNPSLNGISQAEPAKFYESKRVQTVQMCSAQKQCVATNLGSIQKYRDNLIRNKEVQTQIFRNRLNFISSINCGSQYEQIDFLSYFESNGKVSQFSQWAKNQNQEKHLLKCKSIQSNQNNNQQLNEGNTILELEEINQQQDAQNLSKQKLNRQQQNDLKQAVLIKKRKNNPKKTQARKKITRPSIFKRASMVTPSISSNFNSNGHSKGRSDLMTNLLQVQVEHRQQKSRDKQKAKKLNKINQFNLQQNKSTIISKNLSTIKHCKKQNTEQSEFGSQSNLDSQKSLQKQNQPEDEEPDYPTDMLSVMQNMSKLTPKGIYIDETILFLLKKSLFKIKHENCNNVLQKNYSTILKIRSAVNQAVNTKKINGNANNANSMSIKSVIKIIGNVYDCAFAILADKYNESGSEFGSLSNNRRESIRTFAQRTNSFTNALPSMDFRNSQKQMKVERKCKQINLLQILKQVVQKQYPMYKIQDVEHKIINLAKSVEYETCSNYMIKNFMLLSCLDDNIFAPVIFLNDVEFYFSMLNQLNTGYDKDKEDQAKENRDNYWFKISSPNGSYENCYTNVSKLQYVLPKIIGRCYKKKSLLTFINRKITDTLQKIKNSSLNQSSNSKELFFSTKLDIFKCSQLILESLFSFKLDILKSFAQLTEIKSITPNSLITQHLLIDILSFIKMTKLDKLNTVNKFRYDFGKSNAIQGVNLLEMVNFCIKHDIPDFEQILFDVIKEYSTIAKQEFIAKQLLNIGYSLEIVFPKIGSICTYLHYKNMQHLNRKSVCDGVQLNNDEFKSIISQQSKVARLQQMTRDSGVNFNLMSKQQVQCQIDNPFESGSTSNANSTLNINYNGIQSLKQREEKQAIQTQNANQPKVISQTQKKGKGTKQLWQIIGTTASNSLIHFRVVQLSSSQVLQQMLGDHLIGIYMASLCQLQEKKFVSNSSSLKINSSKNYDTQDRHTSKKSQSIGKRSSNIYYKI